MCEVKLLKNAYADYRACKQLRTGLENDELYVNRIAYFIQQCFEKVIKAYLECAGVRPPHVHSIERLLNIAEKTTDCVLVITDWLENHADTITLWEAETRYNLDFCVELKKVDKALKALEEFLNINGVSNVLRDELRDEMTLKQLRSFLPPGEYDNFSLNVYYQLFKDKLINSNTIEKRDNTMDCF